MITKGDMLCGARPLFVFFCWRAETVFFRAHGIFTAPPGLEPGVLPRTCRFAASQRTLLVRGSKIYAVAPLRRLRLNFQAFGVAHFAILAGPPCHVGLRFQYSECMTSLSNL